MIRSNPPRSTSLLCCLALIGIFTTLFSSKASADSRVWVNVHIDDVELLAEENDDLIFQNVDFKLYVVTRYRQSGTYEFVYTYPHNQTVSLTPNQMHRVDVEGGLSIPIPAGIDTIELELTAVDHDELELIETDGGNELLDLVVTELENVLPNLGIEAVDNAVRRLLKDRKAVARLASRTITSVGSIAYDYISQEDVLQTATIQLHGSQNWNQGTWSYQSPDGQFRFRYEVRVSQPVAVTELPPTPTPNPIQYGQVGERDLNMRQGPSTQYAVSAVLRSGTPVELITRSGNWAQVRTSDGHAGWVSASYLNIISEDRDALHVSTPTVIVVPPTPTALAVPPTPILAPQPTVGQYQSAVPADLYEAIIQKMNSSSIKNQYSFESELFVDGLLKHLNDFQLANEGITPASMATALSQADTGDRVNALVHRIWKDWAQYGVAHLSADPGANGQTPLRQLVIRLAQGRQGTLSATDQRALYNFFTRSEDPSVWHSNIRGVIGAINRDFYGAH